MNILIPDSWLREYLETNATPKDIQRCLSLCGPSIERMQKKGGDYLYDIEVTTNRVDCMSVFGIAREAVAILPQFGFSATLKPLITTQLKTGSIENFRITNDPKLCQRILALKIENLKIESSPKWLSDRLESVGIRPINNLVDITNYVMWEIGHPAHIFDFDRISSHQMIVREAKKGEKITTLDEIVHTMISGEVLIDDGTGKIIDLPSIMGTSNSVVTPDTQTALFFIDSVVSRKVRFASMTHAIRTNAATLLEKDIDPELGLTAISRMAKILKEILPRAKFSDLLDIYPNPVKPTPITFDYLLFSNLIGVEIPKTKIDDIFNSLNFKIHNNSVTPPSYRSKDIQIKEDLVEEIARIYGYHNIPSVLMAGNLPRKLYDQTFAWETKIKTSLKYLGFTESYTYSLVTHDPDGLKLANPLSSEWTQLRTSLTPSHLNLIADNIGKSETLEFFEIADVYLPQKNKLPQEESRLIISSNSADFPKFKGLIEAFLQDIQIINFIPDIKVINNIFIWEIPMGYLISHAKSARTYKPISKFMPIVEDFNINLSGDYKSLENKIKNLSSLINQIDLIDKYENKLTLRLSFHSNEKQLSRDDISGIRKQITELFT